MRTPEDMGFGGYQIEDEGEPVEVPWVAWLIFWTAVLAVPATGVFMFFRLSQ